jgi:endonuclease/exonuclease/phosphatase family metal-dependent hydrolase
MVSISLVSVNIERSKHLDLVVPFLQKQKPEVTTILECMERDVPLFEETLGAKCFYTPVSYFLERKDEPGGVYGQAIFSKYPLTNSRFSYYAGKHDPLPQYGDDTPEELENITRALSVVEFTKDDTQFRFAETHLTKTQKGEATELQLEDLRALLRYLEEYESFVLTGDFNAPRGRKTWDTLASKYKDNIPAHYKTSIDPMHRAAPLPYMVDGVFTTPGYSATDVELHEGVSDHMAITATITKL